MDFTNILLLKEHLKIHPVHFELSPKCQASAVCQPRLLKCDDCNEGFNTLKELQIHNKNYHTRSKPRKSAPTHGRGCGSVTRSPKPCTVPRSVCTYSENGNNKQSITTPSGNENANGTIVGAGQPLKNVPVQQFSDSRPNPITNTAVKKENDNSSRTIPSDLSVVQTSESLYVCHVCKEYFDKPGMVREHQELIHFEYKFACTDKNCFHIFKTKCSQKRHWENKHHITSDENGAVVVKQEDEDAGNVPKQLNASNVSNASNALTGSVNSRGSQKKKTKN